MQHVTLDTAQRLRAAGFPQPEPKFGQIWYAPAITDSPMIYMGRGSLHYGEAGNHAYIPFSWSDIFFAPATDDLLEQLEEAAIRKSPNEYWRHPRHGYSCRALIGGQTRACESREHPVCEILAKLYLDKPTAA